MLTQNDLVKIKIVVDDVIDNRLKKELKPINNKLLKHDKQFSKIHKDLKTIINYFDHNSSDHETRITKIEKHLGFSKFSSM